METVLLLIGVFGLGWLLPELCLSMGSGKGKFPSLVNAMSGLSCVFIAQYFI